MRIERGKNAVQGSIWGILNRLINTLLPFAVRTIIIKEFGEKYLGLNSLFTSLLQVLNLSELGLTNAIVYSMYKPIVEDNYEEIGSLLALYKKIYRIIGIAILVIGLLCLPFLEVFIKDNYPEDINIQILYLIFLLNTCSSYLFFSYKESILSAYQRNDIVNKVRLFVSFVQFSLQVLILLFVRNYYLYALMMVIFTITRGAINFTIVTKMFPHIPCTSAKKLKDIKGIEDNMFGITLGKICTVSRGTCDNLIISSFLGLTALTIFDNYYYILSAISSVLAVIENSMVAGIGNSIVLDSVEDNYRLFKKVNFLYMWTVSWCSICLFCLYQPFMSLWVGSGLTVNNLTMAIFVIYFYISHTSSISNVFLTALGQWWNLKFKSICEVLFNLFLNIFLVTIWGIPGILVATISTLFFINFLWGSTILYKNYFKIYKFSDILFEQIKYLLLTMVCAAPTYMICFYIDKIVVNPGFIIIVNLLTCCIIPNLIYYMFVKKSNLFGEGSQMIKKILRTGGKYN